MLATAQPELFIIGLGVMIPGHITVQATKAMSNCSRLYSIVQEPSRSWLPQAKAGQIEVVNALDLYVENSLRSQNYDRAAEAIIRSVGKGRSIGYVTYGNPMAYDRVAQNLVRAAKETGITVAIVPGISSFDTILCDLNIDMAPAIQVFEASWLFACEIPLLTSVPAILIQVGAFGSFRTHYTKRPDGKSLTELVEYLCRFYPRFHNVSLVRSSGQEQQPPHVRQVSLEGLCNVTAEDLSGASLYLPSAEQLKPNEEIISRMAQK